MANYWAIAIGINQYQALQPLSYAQRDAQVLRDFLVQSADFSPDYTWLFTDGAAATDVAGGYPSGNHIQTIVTQICQRQLQPEDMLWCFFSGYGARTQGNDYLLPIDVDPAAIPSTAISLDTLYRTLRSAPTQKIVLLLDVNRSQNPLGGEGIGEQTARLAQEHGIPTVLSCLPNQFSHETLALRQGLFTATLIEALRQGSVTLEQLAQALQEQLPRQSELHWRPRQDPLVVIPAEKKYQLIVPPRGAARLGTAPAMEPLADRVAPLAAIREATGEARGKTSGRTLTRTLSTASLPATLTRLKAWSNVSTWLGTVGSFDRAALRSRLNLLVPGSEWIPAETEPPLVTQSSTLSLSPEGPSPVLAEPATPNDEQLWKRLLLQGGLIAGMLLIGVLLRNSQSLFFPPSPQPSATQPASPEPAPPMQAASLEPLVPLDPELAMQSAQTAFQAQQYEEAQRLLLQVPLSRRDAEHTALLEQVNRELLNKAKTILIRSRQPMAENQASDFVDAIKVARLIQPDQPLYQEAQQNIDRWSRIIMDMAQGRAERANESSTPVAASNYNAAIGTARLVPTDRPKVHEQAQQAIALWSQMILDLATARAAAGDLDSAIQVAELVPPDTPSHAAAQEAIAGWRNQPAPTSENSTESAVPLSTQPPATEPPMSESVNDSAAESIPTEPIAAESIPMDSMPAESGVEELAADPYTETAEPSDSASWDEAPPVEEVPDDAEIPAEASAPEEAIY